jgi:predicted RNA-binding Zn ribbon-like protein
VATPLEDLDAARARLPRLLGGRLCLDFANTVDPRHGPGRREFLDGYADLVAWGRVAGAIDDRLAGRLLSAAGARPAAADAVLERALGLREALYRLLGGRGAGAADLATLNRELAEAMGQARVLEGGPGLAWSWPEEAADLARPLWPVARSAAELLTSPDLRRVRECLGDNCGWLFLDTSKNHRRIWCSMRGCGNRAKARRHYARATVRTGEVER